MEDLIITKMTEDDLDQVMKIERENFKFPWKRDFFIYDMNKKSAHCLVIKKGEKVLGYVILFCVLDEFHLANIAVDQAYQRQGIGSRLLQEVIKIAKEKDVKRIYLEVRQSNFKAQRFYEKFGFYRTTTRKGYYEDGEDALIYERRINNKTTD